MELLVQVRILAGQLRGRRSAGRALLLGACLLLGPPGRASLPAQEPPPPPDLSGVSALGREAAPAEDSTELHRAARDAQARFERLRLRSLPRGGTSGGSCQERVGRFCFWSEDGDWVPTPEGPELTAHRDALLAVLDSVGRLLPGDDWVAGQRVWYRAEASRWDEALEAALGCAHPDWWCAALEGLAHHGAGRWAEARAAFAEALDGMDPAEARRWRHPVRAVDGDARAALEAASRGAGGGAGEEPDAGPAFLERFWLLADPLWLVPGNDRETAHYARWTVSTSQVGARTPYGLSWGRDLEELTVRHGWALGWERGWPEMGREVSTSGHTHPEGRGFLPPGEAVRDPASATAEELEPRQERTRSLYAPPYAPLFLPMDGQLAVFPRGHEMAVVASHFLPADTSRHRSHQHGRPWLEAGDQAGLPDRAGLFLLPADPALEVRDGRVGVRAGSGGYPTRPTAPLGVTLSDPGEDGGLVLRAPAGRWLVSVERWSPERRRAGRHRVGLRVDTIPPDVARLSDLLLVEAGAEEAPTLEGAAARALPRRWIVPDRPFGVVWELGGLGWRPEGVRYVLSLRKEDGNLLRRAGRWLGLLGEDEPLRLSWAEEGPDRPGVVLRGVRVDPGGLEEGDYLLRLDAELPGRAPLRAELAVRVGGGGAEVSPP